MNERRPSSSSCARGLTQPNPARRSERRSRGFGGLSRAAAAAALCSFATLLVSFELGARQRPIALGEVGANAGTRAELKQALRDAVEQELELIDFGTHRPRQRYVLSATLLKLESVTEARSVRATCVVSVALRHERDATLRAVIHGRATAEEAAGERASASASALRAAVHSAIRRVPETVKASEH